jgi:hypothetical protein
LKVLIATGRIVTGRVINVNRDYRCPAPLPTSGRSRRAFADPRSAGAPSLPCSGSGKLRLKYRRPRRRTLPWALPAQSSFSKRSRPRSNRSTVRPVATGTAVNHAIEACAKIISEAPVDERTRDQWLDRLWRHTRTTRSPTSSVLGDCWGELCASRERASAWADRLIGTVESVWSPARKPGGYFHGTIACLSALFRAGRYEELLALVERAPYSTWHYRAWGVKALAAMGRKAEAIRYAETSRGLNDNPIAIARACEEILLTSGLADEAYARYAIEANQRTTFVSTFRSIEKKYPTKPAAKILDDLVASTPGQEGKWFAAAKDAGSTTKRWHWPSERPAIRAL